MDVYPEHLIDELLKLWTSINMYNICKSIGQKWFQLHGILTWTIHNAQCLTYFFLYVNLQCSSIYHLLLKFEKYIFWHSINIILYLVGIQKKGKYACLVWGPKTISRHSRSLENEVYNKFRYFLPTNHRCQTIGKM